MAFTKQHYVSVAKILADAQAKALRERSSALAVIGYITDSLAGIFEADNERFDYDRFWEAANPEAVRNMKLNDKPSIGAFREFCPTCKQRSWYEHATAHVALCFKCGHQVRKR